MMQTREMLSPPKAAEKRHLIFILEKECGWQDGLRAWQGGTMEWLGGRITLCLKEIIYNGKEPCQEFLA